MQDHCFALTGTNEPILRVEARIEHINPLPPGFQWPQGLPEPTIKKIVLSAFCLITAWPSGIRFLALEIAYPSSKGTWTLCATAPFEANETSVSEAVPLIWDVPTKSRQYKTSFSWHPNASHIKLTLKIHFNDPTLPAVQQETNLYPASQNLVHQLFFMPKI